MRQEGLGKFKKSHLIENRTRDLPVAKACPRLSQYCYNSWAQYNTLQSEISSILRSFVIFAMNLSQKQRQDNRVTECVTEAVTDAVTAQAFSRLFRIAETLVQLQSSHC
jgi:hypothetical protein